MQSTDGTRTSWRAWRETLPGLTMNEVARRSGISSGRLSIIERGVAPTTEEAKALRQVLIAASQPAGEAFP
jgi:transcriptional regulator with XRE-family HTH domain